MTKEEARKYLIDISYALGNMSIEYLTERDGDKMREAIKALEQESVPDKIRAEIEELFKEPAYYIPNYDVYKKVLDIIDKYKAESEKE